MDTDKLIAILKKLRDKWDNRCLKEQQKWYGQDASISEFLDDLDEIIETISENGKQK